MKTTDKGKIAKEGGRKSVSRNYTKNRMSSFKIFVAKLLRSVEVFSHIKVVIIAVLMSLHFEFMTWITYSLRWSNVFIIEVFLQYAILTFIWILSWYITPFLFLYFIYVSWFPVKVCSSLEITKKPLTSAPLRTMEEPLLNSKINKLSWISETGKKKTIK